MSSLNDYRTIRALVATDGLSTLFDRQVRIVRTARTDRYGIRGAVAVDGTPVKFEIIHEGRIALDEPGPNDSVIDTATLTPLDAVATKVLANDDRWADRSVASRDVIDLAMISPDGTMLARGIAKAEVAYGSTIRRALHSAVDLLTGNSDYRRHCREILRMTVSDDELVRRLGTLMASLD
ncbi:hypothetical protein nbrc107696_30940 [Gordonia spumicola]|uniref:Uncharacterized protein n=1 Tax=Gordonia spumicola TaxID=589161 RepID=A0A7I9VB97_9ACTN|nr:hypothetical protein nbrc107696_30940 [Gordonia spumicola]